MMLINYHPEFLTATILNWSNLFEDDKMKMIVLNSFEWLVQQKRCEINAFVIMPNHIHLLWKIADGFTRTEVQGAFFSFTAHEFKKALRLNDGILNSYLVNDADRTYQFWERNPLIKECYTESFFLQKLDYIHNNPCHAKWNLAPIPEKYLWSSAAFYEQQDIQYHWLTHYKA
jgi:REP element-mobilizing transposase RayT